MRAFIDHSGLLLVGTAVAVFWVNSDSASYERVADALHFLVNDVAMAFFFALAAKEVVEATTVGGALHSPRKSAVPIIAAVGGMVGPAVIYIGLASLFHRPDLTRGWAIPCATDIAFSFMVARLLFGSKHPAVPFLLLLAIADDALGLVILALAYPTGAVRPAQLAILLSVALLIALGLRRRRVKSFWPYVLGAGSVSWLAFYRSGLHPALALVPIVPFLRHAKRDPGLLVDSQSLHDTLNVFEHAWKTPVQAILCLFGVVNAGVTFGDVGGGTWIVVIALLLGKPLGIVGATAFAVGGGLQRPTGLAWRDLAVLGTIAGIGFTVSLFFATAAFPTGTLLDEVKMGALFSFTAAPLSFILARACGVVRMPQSRSSQVGPRDNVPSLW